MLDILAVGADEQLQVEWEAEDDVKRWARGPTRGQHRPTRGFSVSVGQGGERRSEARAQTGSTHFALNGSQTTKVPKLHVIAHVWWCTEMRHMRNEPIFSATPPLEALRVLLTTADGNRTHVCTDVLRDVDVRLPDEDPKSKEPGACGKSQVLEAWHLRDISS